MLLEAPWWAFEMHGDQEECVWKHVSSTTTMLEHLKHPGATGFWIRCVGVVVSLNGPCAKLLRFLCSKYAGCTSD